MPDYSRGKIYTIRCKHDPSLIYVGSTILSLAKRLGSHKKDSKKILKYPNHQLYTKIEDWNDWYIELYENYQCNNKEELCRREGEVIRLIGTLNRCIAGRTQEESSKNWRENNKEKYHNYITEYSKKYNEEHKEERLNYSRIYEETKRDKTRINCDCGGFYQRKYKNVHEATKLHKNYLSGIQSSASSVSISDCSSFC